MYCPPTPCHSRDPLRQPLFDGWRTLVGLLSVWLAPLVFLVSLPLSADAVLISTGDGTGNTTPPSGDPGFANVGVVINGLSGVYVRNGWVLTAGHVGEQAITFDGVLYQPIPGSAVHFQNPDGSPADLLAFKLAKRPPLADLLITNNPASLNSLITVIGNGRNRGAATTWMGQDGWTWGSGASIRWGTNRIHDIDTFTLGTHSFWISFDDLRGPIGGQHEADFVTGDSGGAAFTGSGASAELIGILVARATFEGQPASTSLYGNAGVIADLFYYRSDILAIIDQPDCDDSLDDDGDGLSDYPADPGCTSPTDTSERDASLVCDNDLDDDRDGLIDQADPGCADPSDTSERGAIYECDNGLDDDQDQLIDFPDDDGCLHPTNLVEAPEPNRLLLLASGILGLVGLSSRRLNRRAPTPDETGQAPSSSRSTR